MYFNQQAKIKKQAGVVTPQAVEFAHYTNLEESEPKIVFKDKWPIPLASSSFTRNDIKGSNDEYKSQLNFGASQPSFLMKADPIDYDISHCKFEQMEMRDPLFTYDFTIKHLVTETAELTHRFTDKKLRNLGWLVSADGESKFQPFALLKPQLNPQFNRVSMPSRGEVAQMVQDLDYGQLA